MPGSTIRSVGRRGKYIHIRLSRGYSLILHLKMSGRLSIEPSSEVRGGHTHTIFLLDNEEELRFTDTRKFGRVYFLRNPRKLFDSLGPEPLAEDFNAEELIRLFRSRRGRLKPMLLDQRFIAGIGNIYADESCFRARLDPRRQVSDLCDEELRVLHASIQAVLTTALEQQGATIDWIYDGGNFQNHFGVYGRTGEPCHICRQPIERIVLGGRSTHFCLNCQR